MEVYKILLIFAFLTIAVDFCSAGATEGQMLGAARMMRDICQPKYKISDEVADGLMKGNFPEDKTVKCYVNCILEMMTVMKKGKLLYESALKQAEMMLPEELKPEYRTGFANCKDSVTAFKDHCDASYALLKCLHSNTSKFMFP